MTYASETTTRPTTPSAYPVSMNGARAGQANGRQIALVIAAAFVVGALLARWLDWRAHAHPHD
jgi:hypothetical protein